MNEEDRNYYSEALKPLIEEGWDVEAAVKVGSDDFDEFEENSNEHMEVLRLATELREGYRQASFWVFGL